MAQAEFFEEDAKISLETEEGDTFIAVDLDNEQDDVYVRLSLGVENVDVFISRLKKAKAAAVRSNKLAAGKF